MKTSRSEGSPAAMRRAENQPLGGLHADPPIVRSRHWASGPANRASPRAQLLKPFRACFKPEEPNFPDKQSRASFSLREVQAIYRIYWDAEPDTRFGDLIARIENDPDFRRAGREGLPAGAPFTARKVLQPQLESLFRKLPASFPWAWEKRIYVATSYALVCAAVDAPEGMSMQGVAERMRARHPGAADARLVRQWVSERWPVGVPALPFLNVLDLNEHGQPVLAGVGPEATVQSAGSRIVLTSVLARRVDELGRSDHVKYGWSQDDFAAYLERSLGQTFSKDSYESLLDAHRKGRFPGVKLEPWVTYKRLAMERLAKLVNRLFDEGVVNRAQMSRVLKDKHGYPELGLHVYEYVGRYFPMPDFKAGKSEASRAQAEELWKHLEGLPPAQHLARARELGHDEQRARYLVDLLRELHPEAAAPAKTKLAWTGKEVGWVAGVLAGMPIGTNRPELLEEVTRRYPEIVRRHDLRSTHGLAYVLERHLGISSLTAHENMRLAELFADTCSEQNPPTTIAEMIARARVRHPIAYADATIADLLRDWRKPGGREPLGHLLDALEQLPWESLEPPNYEAVARRFAEVYPESEYRDFAASGRFTEADLRLVHSLYWSSPPMTDTEGLLEAARRVRPSAFARVTIKELGDVLRAHPEAFPMSLGERRFALFSYILVDTLNRAPYYERATAIIQLLRARHPGFPDFAAFEKAALGLWREKPHRYPFVTHLTRSADGSNHLTPVMGPMPRLERALTSCEEVAQEVRALCLGEEVRYDWDAEHLRRTLSFRLRGVVTPALLRQLRRDFPSIVPDHAAIRHRGRENLARDIRALYEAGARDVPSILEGLHKKYAYPRYEPSILGSLRSELGSHAVPSLRDAQTQAINKMAQAFLDRILKHPGESLYVLGAQMGLTRSETRHRLDVIRTLWPDDFNQAVPSTPYDASDRRALKDALESAPLFATLEEVHAILTERHPEFMARHPITSTGGLAGVYERELGVRWRENHHARLRQIVADVAHRSGQGYSLRELYSVITYEYDVRLSLPRFRQLAAHWKKHPAQYPELQGLRDAAGLLPWDRLHVPLTRELAEKVGAMLRANPSLSLSSCAQALRADPSLGVEFSGLGESDLGFLHEAFRDLVPARSDLGVQRATELSTGVLTAIAERIVQLAANAADPRLLTTRIIADELGIAEREALMTLRRFPKLFPWSRAAQTDGVDLTLAAHIAFALDRSPDDPLEMIAYRLNRDDFLSERYRNIDADLIRRAAEHYPHLVPDEAGREHIAASRLLCKHLFLADRGQKLETVLAKLETKYPGRFAGRSKEYWVSEWEKRPELYDFVQPFRAAKGWRLLGRNEPHRVGEVSNANPTATRLVEESRQIPDQLELCELIAKDVKGKPCEDIEFLGGLHGLGGQVGFMDILKKLGLDPSRTTLVGVPYSTNDTVVDVLADRGWDVRAPALEIDPETDLMAYRESMRSAMYERLASALTNDRRIVVLDDGGTVSELLATDPFLRDHAHRFSIVEQTRRGITVAEKHELLTSVINAAQALGKALEGHLIGENLVHKLKLRLERIGVTSLEGLRVGVIGNGVVGWPLAEELRRAGAIVTVRDTDATAHKTAVAAGFGDGADAATFFGGQDLIIGATGERSIGPDELALLRDGTILASGTSKLVEFDMATIYRLGREGGTVELIDRHSRPPTIRVTFPDGRSITVLAAGFPLNFDGAVNNLSPKKVELTHALMLIGVLQCTKSRVAGFHGLWLEPQRKALANFALLDEVKDDDKLREQVRLADLRLQEAMAGRSRVDVRKKKRWPLMPPE